MYYILTHKTALNYYKYFRSNRMNVFERDMPAVDKLKIPETCKKEVAELANENIKGRFAYNKPQVLISNRNFLYENINCEHIFSGIKYPKGSFRKVDEICYLPCPELLFYQLAQKLNFADLMLVGLELCGAYCLTEGEQSVFEHDIRPLTTSKKITKYLKTIKKMNSHAQSIRKAIYASKFLSDNSFSPMESSLFIMLCGPRKYGAYRIINMKFNCEVKLSKNAQAIANQKSIYPDISNKSNKLAIEYDSEAYHDNAGQNIKDKLRIDALQHDG